MAAAATPAAQSTVTQTAYQHPLQAPIACHPVPPPAPALSVLQHTSVQQIQTGSVAVIPRPPTSIIVFRGFSTEGQPTVSRSPPARTPFRPPSITLLTAGISPSPPSGSPTLPTPGREKSSVDSSSKE